MNSVSAVTCRSSFVLNARTWQRGKLTDSGLFIDSTQIAHAFCAASGAFKYSVTRVFCRAEITHMCAGSEKYFGRFENVHPLHNRFIQSENRAAAGTGVS